MTVQKLLRLVMKENQTRYNLLLWPISVFLAVVYVVAGIAKLAELPLMVEKFEGWGYPEPMMLLVGSLEIAGAILLVIPRLASIGAVALGTVMVGAIYTHLFRGIPPLALVPLGFLALLAYIGNRRLDSPLVTSAKTHVPPHWPPRRVRGRG